jgi:dephospho-CoA kinase
MTIIGLTGGIASGKSTASERFKELGAAVVDGDLLGHRVYEVGTSGFEQIVNAFGHDLVDEAGEIDRRILGGKVFGAPDEMKRLTDIVWPEIRRLATEEFAHLREVNPDVVIVFEAAVLLEAEWQDMVDEVWVVTTKLETAIARLKSRNGLAREAALARIESQMSNRQRLEFADVKIDNSEAEEKLRSRIEYHWKRLKKRIADPAG